MELRYNPVENNFQVFETAEVPKVEFNLPLLDNPIEISDWAQSVTPQGNIIVKSNLPKMIDDSPETYNIQLNNQEEKRELNPITKGNKKQAVDFFINKGLNPNVSAAIVGNLIHESGGLNTSAKGDYDKKSGKYTAYGLAQWRLDRLDGLKNFAKSRNKDLSDFETQLEWVWQELNSGYKDVLNRMINSRNVGEATKIFMDGYERPNKNYAHFSSRLKHAESLLS